MRFYDSQSQAMHRVERLKDEVGYWPGVIGPDDHGRYRLSYDPDLVRAQAPGKTSTAPELSPDPEHLERESAGRGHRSPPSDLKAGPPEADLDQAETEAWLQDDPEAVPETADSDFARLAQTEADARLEADLSLEADWGL